MAVSHLLKILATAGAVAEPTPLGELALAGALGFAASKSKIPGDDLFKPDVGGEGLFGGNFEESVINLLKLSTGTIPQLNTRSLFEDVVTAPVQNRVMDGLLNSVPEGLIEGNDIPISPVIPVTQFGGGVGIETPEEIVQTPEDFVFSNPQTQVEPIREEFSDAPGDLIQQQEGIPQEQVQTEIPAFPNEPAPFQESVIRQGEVPDFVKFNIGDKEIQVIKNPTQGDEEFLNEQFRGKFPNSLPGEPKTRHGFDRQGNRYEWLSTTTHDEVQTHLKNKFGVDIDQNGNGLFGDRIK